MICPLCEVEVETAEGRLLHHGDCPGSFAIAELVHSDLESRYTLPTQSCPHPERWHSQDWDSAEDEVSYLVAAFVRALRPEVVVETGTAFGFTARVIGEALAGAGVGMLHTVEIDPARAAIAKERCADLPVNIVVGSSLDWAPPDGIGFAWFDSLPALRVPEFQAYRPAMRPGTIVGFHDTADHQGELWTRIQALEAAGELLPIRLNTPRGVVFAEVV